MRNSKHAGAGQLGLGAVTALAVGFVAAGPALTTPASAATNKGSAVISGRTLVVTGTNGPDSITLDADATTVQVSFGDDPVDTYRFALGDFVAISVSLGNGDDHFTERPAVLANKALTVDGGNGNDSITTGDGNDLILAGNGDDTVDAGRGNDRVFLGNGDDFFVWNPGEGSDSVDGGNGQSDVMQFNGANVAETMSLSANGSGAVFLRDIGNIRMDMDNIEIFNLTTLGGNDQVTVNNLDGTAIRHANIDLSTGVPDQSTHTVTVNGTDRSDDIDVTAQDGQVDVGGLQADTRIIGSQTRDHLQIDTLDGDDQVTVSPDVSALIGVGVDLGAGQH
jgi:hypothetical protein